jgi:hypothetical protein
MEWCDNIENVLSQWGEKAAAYRALHIRSYQRWNDILNRIYIPLIVLSSLSGILSFGNINTKNHDILNYVIGVMGVSISILTSVLKFLRCEEKANQHEISAKGFGMFYRTIITQLNLKRIQRPNVEKFCEMCKLEFDRLHNESLCINQQTIEWYRQHVSDDMLCLPELGLGSVSISINRE